MDIAQGNSFVDDFSNFNLGCQEKLIFQNFLLFKYKFFWTLNDQDEELKN